MLWEGGLHMNLRQINELWNEYKEKYDLPKDVQISAFHPYYICPVPAF